MRHPDVIDRLVGAGFGPEDASSRATLVDQALTSFEGTLGRPARWAWFVPGRIEVFGKHTDYAGGRSLLAAVPRGFAVVAAPRDDGVVSAADARWQVAMDVRPHDDHRSFKGWANYIAVVARRLARNFPDVHLGADIVFASDLPRAAGLSSSSALVVGIASALIRSSGLSARADWQAELPGRLELAGYLGAVENGLTFGRLEGTTGVGTHGGSEDHTAILACRAGNVSAYRYVPVHHEGDAAMPEDWRFVVMASGIEADKTGSALVRYNRASLATRALLDVWRSAGRPAVTLAGAIADGPAAAEELGRLVKRRAPAEGGVDGRAGPRFGADELTRRLAHFIAEDGRVPLAVAAFRQADAASLGSLSGASQHDAELLLGNQIAETSALARIAREQGAFAASSFGAGFGGSVWALVASADAPDFQARWRTQYQAAFPAVGKVQSFVARPAPAATEIEISE
jgi:galactokinase